MLDYLLAATVIYYKNKGLHLTPVLSRPSLATDCTNFCIILSLVLFLQPRLSWQHKKKVAVNGLRNVGMLSKRTERKK